MSGNRRIEVDVNKLVNSNFNVEIEHDNLRELIVEFPGPSDTPYDGGLWLIRVELPRDYPFSSPSVVFRTPIFHPNVDDQTGSVCLDVINQTWTPIFGLVNIFESFLPQLLAYPNAVDPLNRRAASFYNRSQEEYINEVRRYVEKYAKSKKFEKVATSNGHSSDVLTNQDEDEDSSSEMSSLDEISDSE